MTTQAHLHLDQENAPSLHRLILSDPQCSQQIHNYTCVKGNFILSSFKQNKHTVNQEEKHIEEGYGNASLAGSKLITATFLYTMNNKNK